MSLNEHLKPHLKDPIKFGFLKVLIEKLLALRSFCSLSRSHSQQDHKINI